MWTIENGELFDGKKLWLVPGKKYLFGRTVSEPGQIEIADKSVSRRHLTIEIGTVGPDDCGNPKSRSKITLTDLNTKVGTVVNEVQIRGKGGYEMTSDVNEICIGKYKTLFRITWHPVVLSFSFSSKELKAKPLEALYATFGPLDIKVLTEYERDATTHVVVKKRNTAKGLRALINGKYIVDNDTFIKAIVDATTPGPNGTSLQEDFERNFPDAAQYLPERGSEPTDEPASAYAPDPSRESMFDGYTFVFYDKAQFETLLAPITDGRGKALFREVTPLQTPVDEFVRYVKNVAGEKGVGEFEDGSEGKGVVVVGFYPTKGDGVEWFQDFARQVALNLDQRLIVQSEFLDAILKKDASLLRRPLEVEMSGVVASIPATNTNASRTEEVPSKPNPVAAPNSSLVAPSQTTPPGASITASVPKDAVSQDTQFRRGRSRRAVTSRFSGFDDDDDDDPLPAPASLAPIPETMVVTQEIPEESQGLFVSQDPNREPDSYRAFSQSVEPEEQSQSTQATRSSRKRPAPPIVQEKSYMDSFAPTTASFKRQRRERGEPTPPPQSIKKEVVAPEPVKKKEKKEVDILALAGQQRERAEAAARAEEESLKQAVSTIDVEEMRRLTIVEDMEVKRSKPAPKTTLHVDESERWDDKWNGRKNFKKFRRKGAGDGPVRARARVIVPLEEVKKKDHGFGDDYWGLGGDDNDTQRRRKKGKGKETKTQEETQEVEEPISSSRSKAKPKAKTKTQQREITSENEDEELPENPMHARSRIPSETPEIIPESDDENVHNSNSNSSRPNPIDTHVSTARSSGASTTQGSGLRSGLRGNRNARESDGDRDRDNNVAASGNKRTASNTLVKGGSAKRTRMAPSVRKVQSESEEEDEDRFTFR
ncbi:6413a378-5fc9-454c-a96e-e07d15d0615b [Sclerotinia trifoliorum]|uniref:6413a378-5fc9-454c-a96e-e07d15d0615b n=1 Tax=Sclerotinia trifoliorum TaxID=28548 RepID=A0A8H2VWL9_9HELO|nr:6413a378-5fc9-454c-a96e-e07d15d0615b [Sclerotinia trifoliorum]